MNKNYSIGILDSGVGGLNLLKEIKRLLPNENILYFTDTINNAYQEMNSEKINETLKKNLKFLSVNDCKLIVVSCDILSAAVGDVILKNSGIPIITYLDSTLNNIGRNKYKSISLFGSSLAVSNKIYHNKILKDNRRSKLLPLPCDELLSLIEAGKSCKVKDLLLDDYLSLIPKETDALLLTSPRYSFITEDIRKRFDYDIIDPSEECAREVYRTLKDLELFNSEDNKGRLEFFVTGDIDRFKFRTEKILQEDVDRFFKVNI